MDRIPGLNEIHGTIESGDEILEALYTREFSLNSDYDNGEERWQDYLNMESSLFTEKAKWQAEKARLELLREKGSLYFEQGYRLDRTARHMLGISYDVPENALVWRKVTAGHIATSACTRIEYVYQKKG